MKKFYVIGSNSSKSLSPTIFNYWFSKYKIKASYKHLQLNNKNFDIKIKEILQDKNLVGLKKTIPFKQKIMKHIKGLNKHSREINAVNC
jgi:Shikimate 5-dehydrogenase